MMLPPKRVGGGLMGGFANPLTMGGLGLLTQGPSLSPINPWQGLASGMMMGSQMQNQLFDQQMKRQELEAEETARAQEARQAAAQRSAQVAHLVSGGMPQAQAENLVSTGQAEKFITPPPIEKDPLAQFRAYQGLPAEEQASYREYRQAGAPRTEIDIGGPAAGLTERPLSPEEAASLDIPPDQASNYLVTDKGAVKLKPETTEQKEIARLDAAKNALPQAFAVYEQRFQDYQSGPGVFGAGEAGQLAEDARDNLAVQIAIVESKGAEPNPNKIAEVKRRLPDFSGPIDRSRFPDRLQQMRELLLGAESGVGGGGQADFTYNPETGGLE